MDNIDNIDYTHDTLFCMYIKKFGGFFNICCVTHMSHAIYTAVSV